MGLASSGFWNLLIDNDYFRDQESDGENSSEVEKPEDGEKKKKKKNEFKKGKKGKNGVEAKTKNWKKE